jgi:ABC-2 type transport system ATP-binding protein
MIRTVALSKTYGAQVALRPLDLHVPAGELFVLLGSNGAGKTTTMNLLTTLLRPTSGSAFIAGHSVITDPMAAKEQIGYLPDAPALYDRLTGPEFLAFVADLRGLRDRTRVAEMLDLFDLAEAGRKLLGDYSLGMRKKLAFAAAILHRPRALLLDEPTGGLDPRAARVIKDLIPALCEEGVAVLMTTHVLELAEPLADRIGILHDGALVACGTVDEIVEGHGVASLEDAFLAATDP